jgi:hypothetical protein
MGDNDVARASFVRSKGVIGRWGDEGIRNYLQMIKTIYTFLKTIQTI